MRYIKNNFLKIKNIYFNIFLSKKIVRKATYIILIDSLYIILYNASIFLENFHFNMPIL